MIRSLVVLVALASSALVAIWLASTSALVSSWLLAPGDFDVARLAIAPAADVPASAAPAVMRAFYSGHSLSDGVPEEIVRIAASKGRAFEFDVESLPGSLIRERLERRAPGLFGPRGYDLQVVTERHDLPYTVRFEQTVSLLERMHEALSSRNAAAETLFYHVWLEIDLDHPEQFVRYERQALVLWECVASAVNRSLAAKGRASGVRVLPGGSALAELVDRLVRGEVAGAPGDTPRDRVQHLFTDQVHPSAAARHFMGAVHYAALFGESPAPAAPPPGVAPQFALELERVAWEQMSAYAPRARARATRDMAVCRDYAVEVACPAFAAHPRAEPPEHLLRLWRAKRQCQTAFASEPGSESPFH